MDVHFAASYFRIERCNPYAAGLDEFSASLAQLVEHALRKRIVVGSIPTGGSSVWQPQEVSFMDLHYPELNSKLHTNGDSPWT